MANYVSRGRGAKKSEAFEQLEVAFRAAVRKAEARSIAKLGEQLKRAKLAEIKALIFSLTANPSDEDRSAQVQNLRAECDRWTTLTIDEIASLYS